jgi:hypothetical protein
MALLLRIAFYLIESIEHFAPFSGAQTVEKMESRLI